MDVRRGGLTVAAVGAAAQLAGLGVDAWLHARDPSLAARESPFSLGNAGHALLVFGLVLVVTGIAMAATAGVLSRRRPAFQFGVPLVVLVALMGAVGMAASSGLADGHDHIVAASAPGDVEHHPPAPTTSSVAPAASHDHGHGDGSVVPDERLDPATRDALAAQLVTTREVALAHPTVADAERAGYRAVTGFVPLIGAHYIRWPLMDSRFDIHQPEMLLYDGTAPTSRMVGLSYYVRAGSAPEGFAGPNDHWHRHLGLCIDLTQRRVVGGEGTSAADCRARGGQKVDGYDGWMVHAWVVPAWESPAGVFSAEHPGLR